MQYDLSKLPQILYYIKSVSGGRLDNKGTHFATYCPYCGDQFRRHNPSHGHLYISKTLPLFYCHKCSASGTILRLLVEMDFDDQETLNYLKSIMKFNFVKDYIKDRPKTKFNQKKLTESITNKIKKISPENLNVFNDYLTSRLGVIPYTKFLLYPTLIQPNDKIKQEFLAVGFNNSNSIFVGARLMKQVGKIRYKTNPNSLYYFQEFNFEKITNIILSEGVFDILNIYLYTTHFSYKDTFFMSMSGKNYLSVLERLIIQDLLIGDFHIHFVLDSDNKYSKFLKFKAGKLASLFNPNIKISVWKPVEPLNDLGDFPLMEKCV